MQKNVVYTVKGTQKIIENASAYVNRFAIWQENLNAKPDDYKAK